MADRDQKGRQASRAGDNNGIRRHPERSAFNLYPERFHHGGALNPAAKLREVDVPVIRSLADAGVSRAELARRYGVTWQTVDHVVRRVSWVDVP